MAILTLTQCAEQINECQTAVKSIDDAAPNSITSKTILLAIFFKALYLLDAGHPSREPGATASDLKEVADLLNLDYEFTWAHLEEPVRDVIRAAEQSIRDTGNHYETLCYSDHNEDIRTKGSCDYCRGTATQ